MRSLRIEHESKIALQTEKITNLIADQELRIKQITELDQKIINLNETITKKDELIKNNDLTTNNLRLKNEAAQAIVNGLESEKTHLELSLNENRTLKEQYYEKSEIL